MDLRLRLEHCHAPESTPFNKYPAKQHAQRVAEKLGVEEGLIYLPGTPTRLLEDSDMPIPFHQRRYFYYITGVNEIDCHVTYDIGADILNLYIPKHDLHDTIYNGPGLSIPSAYTKYDVDVVELNTCVAAHVEAWARRNDAPIFVLHQQQQPETKLDQTRFNTDSLQNAMNQARVIKDHHEIELIRKANEISAEAHRNVLRKIKTFTTESEVAGIFMDTCISNGAPNQAYDIIAAAGENASTLHYARNNDSLADKQLMCLDAGCEYDLYASDVTRSFPLSGSWTKEAKDIYELVQAMQDACVQRMGAGVRYIDLHILAHKVAIRGLLDLGILHNGTVAEIYEAGTSLAFYPHGLGHHIGLDVHDVLYRDLLRPLKAVSAESGTSRSVWQVMDIESMVENAASPYGTTLEENMVLTVEPGIYFNRLALESVYLPSPVHAKFINPAILKRYLPVGGVRIEDNYLITSKGNENLTTAPKGNEALRIINGDDTDSHTPAPLYCPIRGRHDMQTYVDTTEIRRTTKRRLASLQYAEQLRRVNELHAQSVLQERGRNETIALPPNVTSSTVSSARSHPEALNTRSSKHAVTGMTTDTLKKDNLHWLLDGNETETLGTRFSETAAKRMTADTLHWLLDGSETESMLAAIEETETNHQECTGSPQGTRESWEMSETSTPLILVDETSSPSLQSPTSSPCHKGVRESEWHHGATPLETTGGPTVPQKVPEIPAKPMPYRNSVASLRSAYVAPEMEQSDRRPSIDLIQHSVNSSVVPNRSNTTGCLPDRQVCHAADPHPFQDYNTRRKKMVDASPVRHMAAHRQRQSFGHNTGYSDIPPQLPNIRTKGPLRNRQSMPLLPCPAETSEPQKPPGNPFHAPVPVQSQLPWNTNPFRDPNMYSAITQSSELYSPPSSYRTRMQLKGYTHPTHQDSQRLHVLEESEQSQYLKPWWLVQAEGELRRKHPMADFRLRLCPVRGWQVTCSQCSLQSSMPSAIAVGPGLTLDEFEQHLWSIDHAPSGYVKLEHSGPTHIY